ncbi:MAG: VanZ family protein [Planctomycetes bacterium]|nr:VanZ family protein [Planctomycetota bacterium]
MRRHKYIIAALAVYWPALFILTHIPVPGIARQSGMSDKTMHILAYMVLTFLAWLAVSPYKKVNWREVKVWAILAVIVWYGLFDEWFQGRVGRSANLMDFYADLVGAMAGLAIMSIFSFWPGLLAITAIFVFAFTNLSRIDTLWQMPYLNIGFHFTGYAFFTLVWIQFMHRFVKGLSSQVKWLATALSMPLGLLCLVKACSVLMGKNVGAIGCLTAVTAIVSAVFVSWLTCRSGSNRSTVIT